MDSTTANGIKVNKGSAPRYFSDGSGNYLGGWADMPCPIAGAVEVPAPPASADQRRLGSVWLPALAAATPASGSTSPAGVNVATTENTATVTIKL